MKKFTGLVVILAALVLGGYYGMGVITERTVKHNLDMVNQSNGVYADVSDYQRGWFESHATMKWRIHIPERAVHSANNQMTTMPAQDINFQMPLTIYHGPFIFTHGIKFGMGYAESKISLPETFVKQFESTFTSESTQPEVVLSMMVNYLNSSKLIMTIPEFKLIGKKDKSQFDWMGMSSTVKVNSSMDKMKGNVTIDGLKFAKDDVSAVLGEIVSNYNLYRSDSGLILGNFSLSLPSFVIKNKDNTLFELNNFDIDTSNNVDDGLFNAQVNTTLDKIATQGKTYGPGKVDMAIRNLDAEALARINEQANKAQNGSQVEKQKALFAIMPELPKLFSRGAEFEISTLSFKLPEGTIDGNLMITLPKSDKPNPIEMMQKVQGKGQLKIPAEVLKQLVSQATAKKMAAKQMESMPAGTTMTTGQDLQAQSADQVDKQIADMVQSGLLVMQGNDYVISMALSNGQLTVNGNPYNPAMMRF